MRVLSRPVFWIIERRDEIGRSVAIIGDDDQLEGGEAVRYRLLLRTEDYGQAVAVTDEANFALRG